MSRETLRSRVLRDSRHRHRASWGFSACRFSEAHRPVSPAGGRRATRRLLSEPGVSHVGRRRQTEFAESLQNLGRFKVGSGTEIRTPNLAVNRSRGPVQKSQLIFA
jgi:hypothetical protein